ncbi:MAG: efflux RND transporter periplasmic adaptor subunit [Planctomycetes bacterium]|nr:efflux RND transporter periplasmic adaptor subunit [Planctomycetota bacterium]
MKKAFGGLVALAIAAVLGWQIYLRVSESLRAPDRAARRASVAVETAPVTTETLRAIEELTGTLIPRSEIIVAPKIAGRLDRLFVDVADPVKNDQLIASLDGEEYQQQADQAEAELAVAKANVEEALSALEIAGREYERVEALRKKGIVAESELDVAEAQRKAKEANQKVALAQVAQREAALKAAKVRLDYTKIKASWTNGSPERVVGERFVYEGSMLRANEPIVSILDIAVLKGIVYVTERDYSSVQVGQDVSIATDAFPDRTFSGTIARIAPLLREESRQARVEIEVPNPERILKPGLFIRARIELARRENATAVPLAAVVKRGGEQGVFVADAETMRAHFVPVRTGIAERDRVEILDPPADFLSARVITLGQHLLEDGTEIALTEPAEGEAP